MAHGLYKDNAICVLVASVSVLYCHTFCILVINLLTNTWSDFILRSRLKITFGVTVEYCYSFSVSRAVDWNRLDKFGRRPSEGRGGVTWRGLKRPLMAAAFNDSRVYCRVSKIPSSVESRPRQLIIDWFGLRGRRLRLIRHKLVITIIAIHSKFSDAMALQLSLQYEAMVRQTAEVTPVVAAYRRTTQQLNTIMNIYITVTVGLSPIVSLSDIFIKNNNREHCSENFTKNM